ncbi:MAG: hypothetical protein JWN52_4074 [Actinomycetia bacterium]|nr:hypothetical protein [Actinomycetes bacterium]
MTQRDPARREEGQAQIVLLLAVLAMLFLSFAAVKIAQANDLRSRAQTAADAAAIGALTPLRDAAARLAMSGIDPDGMGFWGATGAQEAAARYAGRNGADLVGDIHVTGAFGHTVKVNVASKGCVLLPTTTPVPTPTPTPSPTPTLCTDAEGNRGEGRRGPGDSIARLIFPGCHYTLPSGDTPQEGGLGPSALVCGDVTVYSPDGGAADFDRVAKLFKIRLVDQEDPEAYIGGAGLPVGGAPYTGAFPNLPAATPEIIKRIIAFARAQIGKLYVWGAAGPNTFDCSGLTQMAYRAGGIPIPRVTYTQWTSGAHIQPGQEQPGDLVFFYKGSNGPEHVGLVVSAGMMIEAPHTARYPGDPGGFVRLAPYTGRNPVGFVRPGT